MKTRALAPDQVARAKAKAKTYGSTLEQELFLAAGGTLREWYRDSSPEHESSALPQPDPTHEGLVLQINLRLLARLKGVMGNLNQKETDAVADVARMVAAGPTEEFRKSLEQHAFTSAVRLALGVGRV